MAYFMTITSSDGNACAGASDHQAPSYPGKVVEEKADRDDSATAVTVTRDGEAIGPASTVGDMTKKAT